jgi:DNA primase
MPGIDFALVRKNVTMQDVLRELGFVPTTRKSAQLRGGCPVHQSSTSAGRHFCVNLATGRYYCHKCGSHGNALELWAAVNELTIYAAALELCERLGHEVPWITRW